MRNELLNKIRFLFFSFLFSITLSAQILDKPVSIQIEQTPLSAILEQLSIQTDAQFTYDKNRIPTNKKFNLQAQALPLEEALNQLFLGTNIQVEANNNYLVLYRENIPYYTISGFIQAAQSGETLVEANIFETHYYLGTTSNSYGFYSLSLPEGRHVLKTSYVGYQDLVDTIDLYKDVQQNIFLQSGNDLTEVVVIGNTSSTVEAAAILQQSQDNSDRVNIEKAQSIPTVSGQSDILKAVQLLPGVISGGLNGNKLYVRGGNLDQNLVLLDDVPLYNLSHIFGVVSSINGDIIQDAKTYLDGFPARYGGRLSSLIDIRTREGNKQKLQGGTSLGLFIASAYLEGPIQKGKSSFLVSARKTWLPINFQFYDLNAKTNFRLSQKDRLFFSFYTGTDVATDRPAIDTLNPLFEDVAKFNWRNTAISLRWNRILGKKIFANTTLLQGTFDFNIHNLEIADSLQTQKADLRYNSYIRQHGIKIDFNYLPSVDHHIRLGASYRYLRNNPSSLQTTITSLDTIRQSSVAAEVLGAHQPYVYLEDDYKMNQFFSMNIGIHVAAIRVQGKNWWSPQLRFLLNYTPNAKSNWSVSYAEMAQFIHLLNNSSIEAGDIKWVSATKNIRPSTAKQVSIEYQSFFKTNWKISLSAYYKKMEHLRRFKIGGTIVNSIDSWEGNTIAGQGKAYGAELLLAKTKGATQGWMAYALSKNSRQFPDLINNRSFPHQQDRRHTLNLNVHHQFKEKKGKQRQLSVVWTYATGQWATLPERGFLSQSGVLVPDYEVVNNFQLKPNHRMDVAYSRKKTGQKGWTHQWTFGIYNVYGQINPYATFLEWNTVDQLFDFKGEYFTDFPMPFVTYGFQF